MKVSRKDIDKLNSVLSIEVVKNDYESNVDKVLVLHRLHKKSAFNTNNKQIMIRTETNQTNLILST